MVTIRTKEDLIRALQEDPEWRAAVRSFILTEELLALPARFEAFVEHVDQFIDDQKGFNQRVDQFIDDQKGFNQRVDQFIDDQKGFNQHVDQFIDDQKGFNQRVDQFIDDQKGFNQRVDQFIDDQKGFNKNQEELNQRVDQFIDDQKGFNKNQEGVNKNQEGVNQRVESRLANLDGNDLERRARESILNIAKDHLDLTRGRVLLSRTREMDPGLRTTLDEAEEQGLVTSSDISNLEVADIILWGRRDRDRRYVHVVMEVSRTISNNDIQRAHNRAKTLAAATGEEASAAVVGAIVQPPQQRMAEELGVATVTPAMLTNVQTE